MSRSDSIAIGAAVIAIAAVIEASCRVLAVGFLLLGIAFIIRPYFLDWKYGEYRPSKREIGAMSLEEYRKRIRNPKFRKYIDDQKIKIQS